MAFKPRNARQRLWDLGSRTCYWCGTHLEQVEPPADSAWTIEHLLPVAMGGGNTQDNLVLACSECNNKRGDRLETPDGFEFSPMSLKALKQPPPPNKPFAALFQKNSLAYQDVDS